ncbi:hypothetical protein BsWGS_07107 [Bradybaena similaris]
MDSKQDLQTQSNADYSATYSDTPPQQPPPYYQSPPVNYGATNVVVGQPMPSTFITVTVDDHMSLAVFACLCCFWPVGLIAILKANESREALARGDVQAATLKSREARKFALVSIGAGVIMLITVIVIAVVLITSSF